MRSHNENGNGNGNGKTRSHSRTSVQDLWKRYWKSGKMDLGLRNRLVEHYLPLIEGTAARGSLKFPVDYDDMFQMAAFGLMDAVEAFDPEKGAKFETFCQQRLLGAIIDAFRDQDWVSRRWRDRKKRLERVRESLRVKSGGEPTVEELASKLELPEDVVKDLLARNLNVTSLDILDREGRLVHMPSKDDGADQDPFVGLEGIDHHLKGLSDLERAIVVMYFDEDFTMAYIGELLDLSESRISQILKDVLLFLRQKMQGNGVSK